MTTIELNYNQSQMILNLVTKENFYAEEGFSDVSNHDVYDMVGRLGMDLPVAKRTLTSLVRKGILFTEVHEHIELNKNNRWVNVKCNLVYLSEKIWHMVGWDKNAYGDNSKIQDVEFIYTDKPEEIKEVNPTGPRGPLAELTGQEFNVNNSSEKELAFTEALKKTDAKNAKTAMAKFLKSYRQRARYYGVILIKK